MNDHAALRNLYRQVVLEHSRQPVGHHLDIDHTHRAEGHNPVCGDAVDLRLRVADGTIEAAAFFGESCALCTAASSLLCAHLPGEALGAVVRVRDAYAAAIRSGDDPGCPDWLRPMVAVRRYPARVECALLPWDTAVRAVGADA